LAAGFPTFIWVSNRNWILLAVSYRLDRYVYWAPSKHLHLLKAGSNLAVILWIIPKKKSDDGSIKYWADIWEAWWDCIFWERILWNEDMEDIKSIFRQLIFYKYQKLLKYSSQNWTLASSEGVLNVTVYDIMEIEVIRSYSEMEEYLGSSNEQMEKIIFGYIAALNVNNRDIIVFAASKGDAVEKMIEFTNSGRSCLITVVYKLMKAIPRRLPSIIEGMDKQSNGIRQKSFEAIVRNLFGTKTNPLSESAMRKVYTEIQNLQRTLIAKSPNIVAAFKEYTKQFTILFFYEVYIRMISLIKATLAIHIKEYSAAMTAVLCVILFYVLKRGQYTNLLQECISYHDKILIEIKHGDTLSKPKPSNFSLKINNNPIHTSGKVISFYF
jgi:hypothetical protein